MLYKNSSSQIINNNFLSSCFDIRRGVRQGEPLSPTLFILSIECLIISLKTRVFQGIKIKDDCCKLSLCADDLTIYLNGSLHQFERVFMKVNVFSIVSVSKTNFQKSQAVDLGFKFVVGHKFLAASNNYRYQESSLTDGRFQDTCFVGISETKFAKKFTRQLYKLIWGLN